MATRIGHYRILGTLGRGGMGEVYVAHDERLDRKVALKSIRAEFRLDTVAKARFMREARVLSSLDHADICRIFDYIESGESDYLVLELIEGEPLGHALRRGLDRVQRLRIAEQIARVLIVAHAAGVVHRDLKPDNVMLLPAGDIKVLDFGLARPARGERVEDEDVETAPPVAPPVEDTAGAATVIATPGTPGTPAAPDRTSVPPDPAGGASLDMFGERPTHTLRFETLAGQVMGTPLYMSPEQAEGAEVTAASDMYSFGLLLQELFTGRSSYEGEADVTALLEKVRRGDTLPVEGVDRHLASLIRRLKTIAPAERPTAVEAAQRLRRIRQAPRRMVRRAVAAAMIAVVLLAGVKYTIDVSRERAQAIQARNDAEDLLTFMLGDLRERLEPVGRLDVLDAVGDKALDYFARLPERDLGDDDLYRRANALRLIGIVRYGEGDYDAAEQAFDESLAIATGVVDRNPMRGAWLKGLGESHAYIGFIDLARGDLDDAMASFDEYSRVARALVGLDADNPDWQMERAYAHTNRGVVFEQRSEIGAAAGEIEASIAIKRRLVDREPENAGRRRDLANGLSWLMRLRRRMGDLDGASEALQEEITLREAIVAEDPKDAGARYLLAICRGSLGDMNRARRRSPEAREDYRRMNALLRELVDLDPANAEWQRELAVSYRLLAQAEWTIGEPDRALESLRASRGLLEDLVAREPSNVDWQLQLIDTRGGFAAAALDAERWDEAARECRASLETIDDLGGATAESAEARVREARVYLDLGRALDGAGDAEAAREAWRQGHDAIERLMHGPRDPTYVKLLALTLLRLDRVDEARPIVEELRLAGRLESDLAALAREKGIGEPDP